MEQQQKGALDPPAQSGLELCPPRESISLAEAFQDRQKDLETCLRIVSLENNSAPEALKTKINPLQLRLREYLLQLKIWLADCDTSEIPNALSIEFTTEPVLYRTIANLVDTMRLHTIQIFENFPQAVKAAQFDDKASLESFTIIILEEAKGIEEVLESLRISSPSLYMAQALKSNTGPYANIQQNILTRENTGKSSSDMSLVDQLSADSDESELEECPQCKTPIPWQMMQFHQGSFCEGHKTLDSQGNISNQTDYSTISTLEHNRFENESIHSQDSGSYSTQGYLTRETSREGDSWNPYSNASYPYQPQLNYETMGKQPRPMLLSGPMPARRSHTKSRKGCDTCKRRHIKCDEEKPQCRSCIRSHIICEYSLLPSESYSSNSNVIREKNAHSRPGVCERCERLKLVCSVQQPCTSCVSVGMECVPYSSENGEVERHWLNERAAGDSEPLSTMQNSQGETSETSSYMPTAISTSDIFEKNKGSYSISEEEDFNFTRLEPLDLKETRHDMEKAYQTTERLEIESAAEMRNEFPHREHSALPAQTPKRDRQPNRPPDSPPSSSYKKQLR